MARKAGPGRKRLGGSRIAVRVSEAQHAALERAAREARVDLSTYVREMALRGAGMAQLSEHAWLAEGRTMDCQCGEWSGEKCAWHGPRDQTVVVEFMPAQHRDSHEAAGNRGTYPANGARRIRVERSCADLMVETDGEWCEVVS